MELFYQAEQIDRARILKQTAFGCFSLGVFSFMEYAWLTVPEFPFTEYVPHCGLAASVAFLAWRFKTCRDTVFDMTRSTDGGGQLLGIRGLTLLGRPVTKPSFFYVQDLQYHAPAFEDSAFFYVSVVRGEYFRMFRFEPKDGVDRLFKLSNNRSSRPASARPPSVHISLERRGAGTGSGGGAKRRAPPPPVA